MASSRKTTRYLAVILMTSTSTPAISSRRSRGSAARLFLPARSFLTSMARM